MIRARTAGGLIAATCLLGMLAACTGNSSGPSTSTTTSSSTTSSSTTSTATNLTITIARSGVTPTPLTVARGSQVTFVNNDVVVHDMQSDPHPEHTDCPEIAQVGFLQPGQSRSTGNLNIARTCGYHDHNLGAGGPFSGRIIVQ